MIVPVLVDSSFLYVFLDDRNSEHRLVHQVIGSAAYRLIVPYVVFTETAFLFSRAAGVSGLLRFYDAMLAANFHYEPVLPDDLRRARQITAQYADAKLDFVDTCLMAIAERLKVETICTFDRRDFSIFRPQHCEYLQVLP
jgi:hypothetical protein